MRPLSFALRSGSSARSDRGQKPIEAAASRNVLASVLPLARTNCDERLRPFAAPDRRVDAPTRTSAPRKYRTRRPRGNDAVPQGRRLAGPQVPRHREKASGGIPLVFSPSMPNKETRETREIRANLAAETTCSGARRHVRSPEAQTRCVCNSSTTPATLVARARIPRL